MDVGHRHEVDSPQGHLVTGMDVTIVKVVPQVVIGRKKDSLNLQQLL